MADPNEKQLYDNLNARYNLAELRVLCFDLGIGYEDLAGNSRTEKTLELVLWARRRGRLAELAERVAQGPAEIPAPPTPEIPAHSVFNIGTMIGGAVGHGAQVHNQQIAQGGIVNETSNKPNVSIGGNMIGNLGDGDFINTGQIAMGDIVLGGQSVPKTKEAFAEQLANLQALLKEAIAKEEFAKPRDGEKAVASVAEVVEELAEVEPDKVTITKRLEEVKERREGAIKALEAGGKLGKVLVKAAPVVAALLKLAQTVF